jgi:hypothetical protein
MLANCVEVIPGLAIVLVRVENAVEKNPAYPLRENGTVDSTENGTTRKTCIPLSR